MKKLTNQALSNPHPWSMAIIQTITMAASLLWNQWLASLWMAHQVDYTIDMSPWWPLLALPSRHPIFNLKKGHKDSSSGCSKV